MRIRGEKGQGKRKGGKLKKIKTELGKGESQKICCFEIRGIEIRSEQKNILTEIMERRMVWKQKRMEKWRRERKDIKGNMQKISKVKLEKGGKREKF